MCQIENTLTTYDPHALIIVYSIDDLESFHTACDSLAYLTSQNCSDKRAKILVANKIDLQRSRVVSALGILQCFLAPTEAQGVKMSVRACVHVILCSQAL